MLKPMYFLQQHTHAGFVLQRLLTEGLKVYPYFSASSWLERRQGDSPICIPCLRDVDAQELVALDAEP